MKNKHPKRKLARKMIGSGKVPKHGIIFDHPAWKNRAASKKAGVQKRVDRAVSRRIEREEKAKQKQLHERN